MSAHSKLVSSILALSLLGLVLLTSVLFDSYQQSGTASRIRSLETYSRSLSNHLARHVTDTGHSLESLLLAARPFDSAEYAVYFVDEVGVFHPGGGNPDWIDKQTETRLLDVIRAQDKNGALVSYTLKFVWSRVELPGTPYTLLLIHREYDATIARFVSEFGVPLFVTVLVLLWITTWAALIFGSLFKKLNRQKDLLKEQAEKLGEARDKALKASLAKGSFLANMSHEIRTPLTAIIGFSEALLGSDQSMEERISAINTINQSGKHLLHIINEILDLSKIEAEKLEVELIQVPILQLLKEIGPLVGMQASEKGLEFRINYSFPVPEMITSDPTRLKQILINLASNAIKFTATGHIHINVSCESEKELMSFEMVDTGIGITKEQSEHIFNPFAQADSSTTRKYGGTGLGLTLSKQLSAMLGGDLSLQSDVGVGSRFTLTVGTGPLHDVTFLHEVDDAACSRISSPQPIVTYAISGSVLVAEDNEVNQRLLDMYISKTGATVTIAGDGQQAVELASSTAFDLVFMDMQMPVMNGIEATEVLRKHGYTGTIVALTANTTPEDRARCLQAGCDDYLPKPIETSCSSRHN
jgi:signal transduction histidine kinase/CheY-like chemotaxis protein